MNEFDPVLFSNAENEFLLKHVGEPTIVALRDKQPGVNAKAVKPVLDRVQELKSLQEHEGQKWAGEEAIRESIRQWLKLNAKWKADHARNPRAPRWPSLFSYDAKGRPRRSGPGSDSHRVKTYFGPAGERIPFAVQLLPDYEAEWTAPGFTEAPTEPMLRVDPATNRIECLVPVGEGFCGHTESYRADSRASYNAARARMSKHLRKATEEREAHLEVYSNEFGG